MPRHRRTSSRAATTLPTVQEQTSPEENDKDLSIRSSQGRSLVFEDTDGSSDEEYHAFGPGIIARAVPSPKYLVYRKVMSGQATQGQEWEFNRVEKLRKDPRSISNVEPPVVLFCTDSSSDEEYCVLAPVPGNVTGVEPKYLVYKNATNCPATQLYSSTFHKMSPSQRDEKRMNKKERLPERQPPSSKKQSTRFTATNGRPPRQHTPQGSRKQSGLFTPTYIHSSPFTHPSSRKQSR